MCVCACISMRMNVCACENECVVVREQEKGCVRGRERESKRMRVCAHRCEYTSDIANTLSLGRK